MSEIIEPGVILVDPTGHRIDETESHISPRLSDLRGVRLGLLDNTKANAEIILRKVADILDAKYEFSEIYYTKKHSSNLPPKPDVLAGPDTNFEELMNSMEFWNVITLKQEANNYSARILERTLYMLEKVSVFLEKELKNPA